MKGSKTEVRPGVWRLRVYVGRKPNGTPIQTTKTFHGGARAADKELRRFLIQVEDSRTPERSDTLEQLLDAWMNNRRRATPYTLAADRGYINNRIRPELGTIRLDRLTARELDVAYRLWEHRDGLSPSTVQKLHSIISAALTQAHKWGWVDRNVAKLATPPARNPTQVGAVPIDRIAQLIERAHARQPVLAIAITLATVTGARRGELCALRHSDIDRRTGTVTIGRSLSVLKGARRVEGATKTRTVRRLRLDPRALAAIDMWAGYQQAYADQAAVPIDPDPYILTLEPRGHLPLRPDTFSHMFKRLCRDLGYDHHLHELRHAAATTMISSGIDPSSASRRLGHARTSITLDIYAHAVEAADETAAELLGRAIPELTGGGGR